jgi:hypothetical protein
MKRWIVLAGLAAMVAGPAVNAEVSDAEFAELKQTLEQALERINELEAEQQVQPAAAGATEDMSLAEQVEANSAKLAKLGWAERIKLSGDFRYRYQNDDIDPFTLLGENEGDDTRNRNRIRARLSMTADLGNNWEVGIGMASGGDDPVSTNQTLGGGGSTKDINLDMAYFDYTGFSNTSIRGGKFKNTLKTAGKSALQWDSDWRPEGVDVAWENDNFFAQALGTYIESDSNRSNTEFSYLLQGGAKAELGPVKLLAGVGYTDIDAEGEECFYDFDDGGCFGNENTLLPGGDLVNDPTYLYDFEVYNVFAEVGFDVGSLPVKVFGDFIKNDAADDFDSGVLVGAQLGKVKKPGSWQVKAYYEELESNATLALLTNSDFGGGGTNGEGYVLSAGYGITDNVSIGLTYYMVEKNSDNRAEINNGEEFDIDTLQADLKFKFK